MKLAVVNFISVCSFVTFAACFGSSYLSYHKHFTHNKHRCQWERARRKKLMNNSFDLLRLWSRKSFCLLTQRVVRDTQKFCKLQVEWMKEFFCLLSMSLKMFPRHLWEQSEAINTSLCCLHLRFDCWQEWNRNHLTRTMNQTILFSTQIKAQIRVERVWNDAEHFVRMSNSEESWGRRKRKRIRDN
jgi:hypothetical protein